MIIKPILEETGQTEFHANFKQAEMFSDIILRLNGTNDTGKTVALEDVGRIRYRKGNQTIVDADFEYLFRLDELLGGKPKFASAIAGAYDMQIRIPRRFGDKNVDVVSPKDQAIISCTFNSAFDTEVLTNTTRVFLASEKGVQQYDLTIQQHRDSIGGAASYNIQIDQDNIFLLLLSAAVSGVLTLTGSNITSVFTTVGEEAGLAPLPLLLNHTQSLFNIEHEDFAEAACLYLANGDPTSRLMDAIKLTIETSGAAEPEILSLGAAFDPRRMAASISAQHKRLGFIRDKKKSEGKASSVAAMDQILAATPVAAGVSIATTPTGIR